MLRSGVGGVGFGVADPPIEDLPVEGEAQEGIEPGGALQGSVHVAVQEAGLLVGADPLHLGGEGQGGHHLETDGGGAVVEGLHLPGVGLQFLAAGEGLLNRIGAAQGPGADLLALLSGQRQSAGGEVEQAGQAIGGLDAALVGLDPVDQQ